MDRLGQNQNPIKFRQFYDNPQFNFNRKKNAFDQYDPSYFIEEKPTFSYENDRNVKYYRGYIQNKSKAIDKYSQNYLDYMKNERINNMRYRTPYQNQNINMPNNSLNNNYDSKFSPNDLYNSNQLSQSYQPQSNFRDDFVMKGRTIEITNPDLYYKQASDDYYNYRQEQKKFLNYNLLTIQKNYYKKKDIDVNPYNKGSSSDILGNTFLKHNPILNPSPSFGYKYFDREKSQNQVTEKSLQNAGNNLINGN